MADQNLALPLLPTDTPGLLTVVAPCRGRVSILNAHGPGEVLDLRTTCYRANLLLCAGSADDYSFDVPVGLRAYPVLDPGDSVYLTVRGEVTAVITFERYP